MPFAIGNHFLPSGEVAPEPDIPPRSDDLQSGRERGSGQLEPHLIVAFAGGTVGDGVGLFPAGDFNHFLGDEGPGDARAQIILALVNRARLNHREDEVARKFVLQIANVDFGRAGLSGLGFKAVEFLLLPDVGAEGDHIGVVGFFEPRKQHRGVETARIG